MKTFLIGATAALAILAAGQASAQPSASATAADTSVQGNVTAGGYKSVNSDGKRIEVKTPYGGDSEAQADTNEAIITQHLNQQVLQAGMPAKAAP